MSLSAKQIGIYSETKYDQKLSNECPASRANLHHHRVISLYEGGGAWVGIPGIGMDIDLVGMPAHNCQSLNP